MVMLPVLSAILQSTSVTIDKVALNIKRFTYKNYTVISFPLIFIFNLIIYFIFRPGFPSEGFSGILLVLLAISILLSLFTNIIFYKILKSEKLNEMQTISLLSRVPLIIFAGLFFADERNIFTIALAIVAALSLVWSHWERHHFHLAKRTWPFLIWTLAISPFGGIISKKLLEVWNPISLQLVMHGVLAVLFVGIYHKSIFMTPKRAIPYLLLTNVLTTIAWILYFFSFQVSGIVFTVLVFSIQPLLVYFNSIFFLKEKAHWKKTLAFIIILVSIALAQVLN